MPLPPSAEGCFKYEWAIIPVVFKNGCSYALARETEDKHERSPGGNGAA